MGNRKTEFSWSWPLIELEWLPEILSSFDKCIEASWNGLQRELTSRVPNKLFSNKIFKQLKILLIETNLVAEEGRLIKITVNPDKRSLQSHFNNLFHKSSETWASFFTEIHYKRDLLFYSRIKNNPDQLFPEIAYYPVFKQWSKFFQYIDLGFLIDAECFMPESYVTQIEILNSVLIEKCLKANGDPRILSGYHSLHAEADFLSWSKGGDLLPLSDDKELTPRIPHDLIKEKWNESSSGTSLNFNNIIVQASESWRQMIYAKLSEHSLSDLNSIIGTCKLFMDHFLFGELDVDNDFLDKDRVNLIKNRWESVSHFKLSGHVWKSIPKLYKDLTRLYWGINFYRNSLRRKDTTGKLYDDSVFQMEIDLIKKIPVRCYRSKTSLHSIIKSQISIYKSILRLPQKVIKQYEVAVRQIVYDLDNYLPENPIERAELLDELSEFIDLREDEKEQLKIKIDVPTTVNMPENSTLKFFYWMHRYSIFSELSQVKILNKVNDKLNIIHKKFERDIIYYEKHQNSWDKACNRLRGVLNNLDISI